MSVLYVNGQDISRLVLGLCEGANSSSWAFVQVPETVSSSPEIFLASMHEYLVAKGLTLDDIEGFLLVAGPGSATALRASHALINALSFARRVPVYSVVKEGAVADDAVFSHGEVRSVRAAVPVYAHEARITQGTKDALRRSF